MHSTSNFKLPTPQTSLERRRPLKSKPAPRRAANDFNANKNTRTRALLLELRALDKSQSPADERRARNIKEEVCALFEPVLRAAHASFLASRAHQSHELSDTDAEELLAEGRVGFCKALDRFDPGAGVEFCTYAYAMAQGEMRHYLRDKQELIREPAWHYDQRQAKNKAEREGRDYQVRGELIPVPRARCAGLPQGDTSGEHPGGYLDEVEEDFSPLLCDRLGIADALKTLKTTFPREAVAVLMFHCEGAEIGEIGVALGCLDETASALVESGLSELRALLL